MAGFSYELDSRDASEIVSLLRCLARLIDQPDDSPLALSDGHLQALTYPAAQIAVMDDPHAFADDMRRMARHIEQQLPGEAPRPAPDTIG
jgi:hypothetical protein